MITWDVVLAGVWVGEQVLFWIGVGTLVVGIKGDRDTEEET